MNNNIKKISNLKLQLIINRELFSYNLINSTLYEKIETLLFERIAFLSKEIIN